MQAVFIGVDVGDDLLLHSSQPLPLLFQLQSLVVQQLVVLVAQAGFVPQFCFDRIELILHRLHLPMHRLQALIK